MLETPPVQARIKRIYVGRPRVLAADGRQSAIQKSPVDGQVNILALGIVGDQQANPDVHGGADKAVHQFAAANYAILAKAFPQAAPALVSGSIGENLSCAHFDQDSVCVGDTFTLGSSVLQVSQPRTPCWKIDACFGVEGMSRLVSEQCLAGWYYRVLQEGKARTGDMLTLTERNADPVTLRNFWSAWTARQPDAAQLQRLRNIPGLAEDWRATLQARIEKMRAMPR